MRASNIFQIYSKVILWICYCHIVQASHFRGASFTWSPNDDGSINVDFRISWRRSSGGYFCDASTISSNSLISDTGDIDCIDGCSGTLGSVSFYCTDYNKDEDWTTGRNTIKYFPSVKRFSFGYSGGAWITLNGGGSDWSFKATVDLNPRADTGKPNTSPTVDMSPVVRLMHGCQHTIRIPVSDIDGDVVRCRWSTGDECADVCNAFSGSYLNQEKCVLTYKADGSTGYYAVALQIADFTDESSTTPLSSIPIQFLVYVFSKSSSACQDKPQFVSPTPVEGACIGIKVGDVMNVSINARSGQRLRSISTISAVGMMKTSETTSQDSSGFYMSASVTWQPAAEDVGKDYSLCFYATDVNGLVSDVRCVHVPVTVGRPKIINIVQKGTVNSWELLFDQKFLIPTVSAFMEIYESSGEVVDSIDVTKSHEVDFDPDNMKISVTFDFEFQPGTKYYVLMSEGLVGRKTSCGSMSEAVNDVEFWTFERGLVGRNTSCDSISEAVNDVEFWPLGPVVDCGCPAEIRNGTITSTNGTLYPSMITYSCDKLFFLVGDRTRICQQNGTWSGSDPVCHISFLDVMWFSIKRVWRKLLPMQLPWMIAD